MAEFLVEFEWYRDQDGYELLEEVQPRWKPPANPRDTEAPAPDTPSWVMRAPPALLSADPRGTYIPGESQKIKRKGGQLEPYRPLDKFSHLCLYFYKDVRD